MERVEHVDDHGLGEAGPAALQRLEVVVDLGVGLGDGVAGRPVQHDGRGRGHLEEPVRDHPRDDVAVPDDLVLVALLALHDGARHQGVGVQDLEPGVHPGHLGVDVGDPVLEELVGGLRRRVHLDGVLDEIGVRPVPRVRGVVDQRGPDQPEESQHEEAEQRGDAQGDLLSHHLPPIHGPWRRAATVGLRDRSAPLIPRSAPLISVRRAPRRGRRARSRARRARRR